MSGQTLENGDPFERTHAQWIRDHFPYYEQIWATYVGNDGSSRRLPILGLSKEDEARRAQFCGCHYSMALYTYLFEEHAAQAITALKRSINEDKHRELGSYLSYTKDFTLFIALIGQICDMVEQTSIALRHGEIFSPVAAFAKTRNNAIHTARIPMGWDYAGVKIAKIAGLSDAEGGWKKFVPWEAMERGDYEYLTEWMKDTHDALLDALRHQVSKLTWGACKTRFGDTGVVRPRAPSRRPLPASQPGFSGHDGGSGPASVSRVPPPSGSMHG